MMKFCYIGALCVFVSLIVTAQSTKCNACWVNGATKCCKEQIIECPGQCMTVSEMITLGNVNYKTIQKTCGTVETCDVCFSTTAGKNLTVRIGTQCRTGDYSNAHLNYKECPKLKPSGFKCPVCYLNDTLEGCTPHGYVDCVGYETQCVEYSGIMQVSDTTFKMVSMQGCITQVGCTLGFKFIPGTREFELKKMICTPAIPKI